MRGGSSVKSSLLASDMSSDKATKLGLAPQRLVSCSQQNSYASLGLAPQVESDKVKVSLVSLFLLSSSYSLTCLWVEDTRHLK